MTCALPLLVLLNVLIIPDKFKGTLSAAAAARAMARGWRRARPGDKIRLLPMSDGGDGFGELMGKALGARPQLTTAIDAAHRPCKARWWYEPRTKTALIDSSGVIGLAMLPPGRFHPFQLDTFGLGLLLRAAARHGAERCLVGIGGSATNDAGFGMASALGWEFLDPAERQIQSWVNLSSLNCLRPPRSKRLFKEIIVAVDVANLLLGPCGATRIYGPQKGLRPTDFESAEICLRRLAHRVKTQFGCDFARLKGAGAAGGLGFGFAAFLGGQLRPGFDLFAARAGMKAHLRWAEVVITGEGALDRSTLMGKGVGNLAKRCRQLRIPCIGLAGTVSSKVAVNKTFWRTYALGDLTTVAKAKAKPRFWLERLATVAAGALARSILLQTGSPTAKVSASRCKSPQVRPLRSVG
ncbi:MAG TPA: glycerate kinase [Candidatus Limnocylindrales bacterium]|nr:glycerate kinase [Candidatus Limnocylindrales bacterium]